MGCEGLGKTKDAPGRGRKPQLSARAVGRALSLARTRAPHGGPWSVRTMASETGLSKSSVQRLWSAHKLQPYRVRDFKLSKDLRFEEKLWDVVGLYLDPPDRRFPCSAVMKRDEMRRQRRPPLRVSVNSMPYE